MESNQLEKDTFMMSESLLGKLDEKTFLGDDEVDEALTVKIATSSGHTLTKNVEYISTDKESWILSFKCSPIEVILASQFSRIDFRIEDRLNKRMFVLEEGIAVSSFSAEIDYPGSYICKLVLTID